jgi:hypothetical protein
MLSDTVAVEFSLAHIFTKDEALFEYLYQKFQSELVAYQPGMSKKYRQPQHQIGSTSAGPG